MNENLKKYKNNLEFDNAQLTLKNIQKIEYAIEKLKLAKVNKEAAASVESTDKIHAEKMIKLRQELEREIAQETQV